MKRLATVILSACLICASAVKPGSAFSARAEGDAVFPTGARSFAAAANAFASAGGETAGEDGLLLPGSYEQYLPLSAPSDVAVTENHTAVADGNLIYVYSRGEGEYRRYEHSANVDGEKNKVVKLQFSEKGLLYFLDASNYLYELDPAAEDGEEATRSNVVCNTFTIFSDVVYFTNVSPDASQISQTTLDTLDSSKAPLVKGGISSKPVIAQDNGVLYYTDAGKYLYKLKKSENGYVSSFIAPLTEKETVVSLAVYSGLLYYTDTAKTLYIYDLNASRLLDSFEGGYSALTVHDGYIYAVENDGVRQYSPAEGAFTDYEICGGSDAENRLADASELLLCGDLLFAADNGNKRVSVYDTKKHSYAVIPVGLEAEFLASDGETLLIADVSAAELYRLRFSENGKLQADFLRSFSGFNNALVGVAGVYGTYYFVTDNNYFYRAKTDEQGGWTLDSTPKPSASHTARLLTQDVYGELYVAYSDGGVRRFTEAGFMDANDAGERVKANDQPIAVPGQAEQIAVDYEQTVYALYQNELYKCAAEQTKYTFEKTFVYGQTKETQIRSFAFGVEEPRVYLLYEGDFVVESYGVPLPTVRSIAVEGADEKIFSKESAEFSVVETAENALMVNFDIAALDGAQAFPYLSFVREPSERTALKLGETEIYNLIAVFDDASKTYTTALVLKRYCQEVPRDAYLRPAEGFTDGKGYLTNAVTLYKYPYLTPLLTVSPLTKNARVTVLGEIDTLDYRYYYVSYTDESGAVRTGYVPKAYVTNFDGSPPGQELVEYGEGTTDFDSLWRMIFLLLGCLSVCVLADYMILRKKKP